MAFNSIFLNSLLLLGTIQGLILTGLLFFSKNKKLSTHLFTCIIFIISLACLNLYLAHQDWYNRITFFRFVEAFVPLLLIMPIGPLIYFYIRASVDPAFVLTKKYKTWFYPVILDLLPHVVAIVYIACMLLGIISRAIPLGYMIDVYNTYVDIPRWLSLAFYLGLSMRYIKQEVVKPEPWLKQFVWVFTGFTVLWLVHLVPYLVPKYGDKLLNWADWYPLYIPLVGIIYWLGIKGFIILRDPAAKKPGTILPEETQSSVSLILKKAMEEDSVYLDPELNLAKLSEHTGIPAKIISTVLNQHLNKSFSDFVNEYRVMDISRRLLDPANKNITITGIAYECGFNSQPTFQRAFKSVMGLTPSEFLAKNA